MAHSIEVRAPFQDHRLVSRAATIPLARRLGWRGGKVLLKRAFADMLPDEILSRPKWGWLPPFYHWLAHREGAFWREHLSEEALGSCSFLDPAAVRSLTDPARPLPEVYLRLWNLLHLVLWNREVLRSS